LQYDAAIITLSSPFNIDGVNVRIAPTATTSTQLPTAGTQVYVAGWGDTQTGGPSSNNLLFVGLPYVTLSTCNATYGGLQTNIQVCAGGVAGQDSCQGDSGGPLFTTATPSNPTDAVIIGIVSFGGNACAVQNEPGVYSDVPGFANAFFQSIITQSASGVPSSGAVASSSGVVAASSQVVVASSSGGVAASSQVVAASSGAVASSSGAVAAASSSKGAVASSVVAAVSSSKGAVASSSGAVAAASSSKGAIASSVVAASSGAAASSQVVVASSGAVASSSGVTKSQSGTSSGSPPETSGAVAASSVVAVSSSGAHASATQSKVKAAKTKTGLAAITCRQECQVTFRSCKQTSRKLRICKRAKKTCVAGCGIVNPNRA